MSLCTLLITVPLSYTNSITPEFSFSTSQIIAKNGRCCIVDMVMSVNCEPGRKSEQRMGGLPERAFEYYYTRVGTRQNDSSKHLVE